MKKGTIQIRQSYSYIRMECEYSISEYSLTSLLISDVSSTAPRDSLFMAVSYEIGTIACRDAEIDFKARTRQAFADLNIRMAGVNELCGVSDCSDLTINVLCGQTGLQDQVVAILEVTIPDCIHRLVAVVFFSLIRHCILLGFK